MSEKHGPMSAENAVPLPHVTPAPQTGKGDPWAHRSKGMRCATCMWFAPKALGSGQSGALGRCRRHAPTLQGFPAVFVTDWCGDHKLDEEAAG